MEARDGICMLASELVENSSTIATSISIISGADCLIHMLDNTQPKAPHTGSSIIHECGKRNKAET